MKNLILRSLLLVTVLNFYFRSEAQVSSYTFSQSSGTYTPITGGTVIASGAAVDDDNYNALPIGFNFNYNGTVYTTFSLNANGFIALGNTVTSSYLAISEGVASNNVIAALSFDLQGNATGELRREVIGSAPNQMLVIQWTSFRRWNATGEDFNFQIILHETSNVIDVVYGGFVKNATPRTAQVGLRGNSNADFNNRTSTTDWAATTAGVANNATITLSTTVLPTSGQTFTWTPPSCLNPGSLSVTNITATTADLNWVAGAGETTWDLYYGPTPLAVPNGSTTPTIAGVTATTESIGGLTALTQYAFYVRADCGSSVYSGWSGPFTFVSACATTSCNYTFNLQDSYGDGWNGASVAVRVNGITVANVGTGFTAGGTFSQNVSICEGATLELVWTSGSWPGECALQVIDPFSNPVASFAYNGAPVNGSTFFNGLGNCTPPALDMQALNLATPAQSCLSANENVDITIRNNSGNIINFAANPTTLDVTVTGPNPQVFPTITLNSGTLGAGATAVVAVATGYDMSIPGTYVFNAVTNVVGDAIPANDAMPPQNRVTLSSPTALPLVQDFNAGTALPAGFNGTMYVANNHGTAGSNGLTYNLYPSDEYAYINLPFIGPLPANSIMEFDYRMVNWSGYPSTATPLTIGDSLNLKISTNCGGTYTMLLSINSTNHTTSMAFARPLIDLSPYAGQSILLRWECKFGGVNDFYLDVDNINIRELFADDAGVVAVTAPTSGCGLTASENITVTIENFGTDPLINPDVAYRLNGGVAVVESTTLTIAPGTTANYTFTAAEDFSAAGTYTIKAYTVFLTDADNTNDTTLVVVNSIMTHTPDYFTDLETDDAALISAGTNSNWAWGDPNSGIITDGNGCGNNAWVTGLTSNYLANTNSTLTTACFDFTGSASVPFIRFDNIYRTEAGFDRFWIESSVDGGANWTKILANAGATGWYNNVGLNVWEGTSAGNTWIVSANTLDGLEGTTAMFRWVFVSDGSVQYEGIGLDNLFIGYNFSDVKATAVTSPVSSCGLTANEDITATFINSSTATLASVDLCYVLDGGSPVCETVNGPFLPGATITHTFALQGDFSATTAHTLAVSGTAVGDVIICDTIYTTITNTPTIISYPYIERFENGTGGWTSGGTASTWAFGTPAKANIVGAGSGVNAWVNGGLTGNYVANENSWVLSPCFETANLPANPWVAFKINWFTEFSFDGAVLQMTKDNGNTWTNVGTNGAPFQGNPYFWYNDNTISGNPGGQQIGWTGTNANSSNGWQAASHPIDTAGLSSVSTIRFRIAFGSDGSVQHQGVAFDDFAIGTLPQVSLGADLSNCGSITVDPLLDVNGTYNWIVTDTSTLAITSGGNGTTYTFNDPAIADIGVSLILQYRDTLGFLNMDTAIFTSLELPLVDLGVDIAICYDDTLVLNAITDPAYTYLWSTGSVGDTIHVTMDGTYTLTTTVATNGCSVSDDIRVYVKPAVDLPATTNVCGGVAQLLDAGAGYVTYAWSTTENTQTISVNTAGTYTVTTTDTIGCVSMASSIVSNFDLPVINIGPNDTTICLNHIIAINAGTGFVTYNWSDGTTLSTAIANGTTLGVGTHEFYCVVSDANGCINSDTIDVIVDACVGVEETISESTSISLYPNPNNGSFQVNFGSWSGNVMLEIYSIDGKLIFATNKNIDNNQTYQFELENKIPGMYIFKVSNGSQSGFQRFVLN